VRVGVYVDGFNLFYGGRAMLPSSDSWKWLNLRSLSEMAVAQGSQWSEIDRLRVNYFTAQVDAAVIISNDSDLAMPIQVARSRVPVGVVNPRGKPRPGV